MAKDASSKNHLTGRSRVRVHLYDCPFPSKLAGHGQSSHCGVGEEVTVAEGVIEGLGVRDGVGETLHGVS